MLALCLLLLAGRVAALAELQTDEAACSSEPCERVNAPMCAYDHTNKLKVYFLNECVYNCSNCLYRKAGSKAEFVPTNLDECLNDSNSVFIHECPSSSKDGDGLPDQANSLFPFPLFGGPGPVMLGDANGRTDGVSMGPLFPGLYMNPQWAVSNEDAPDFSSSNSPGSLSPDMAGTPGPQSPKDTDQNVGSNSGGSDDFGVIAPSFSPFMGPMLTDKIPVIDDNGDMPTFPGSDQSELADSPRPINVDPGFNPMLAPESELQYLSDNSPRDDSDDDILSDGISSMMDDSPSNDFGGPFSDFKIVPIDPTDGTTGDSENDDPLKAILTSSSGEESDDSLPDIISPDDTILYVPSDSPDDSESDDELLEIISKILEEGSDGDADTDTNSDDSDFEISVVYPEDAMPSDNNSPPSDITIIPQDVLIPFSDDTDVNPQVLPLSEGGLIGDQSTNNDVILLAMDPLGDIDGDEISADSRSDIPTDEGSEILILVPEEDTSDGSAENGESDMSGQPDCNDVPLIQELNVNSAEPESRDISGGFSNLLQSMLLQKLLFSTDAKDDSSKQGNTYIDANVHVEINVQPEEDKGSRNQHHPRYWNDDRGTFSERPNFPGYGFRDNDVDYAPAARQAALVMTTIGKAATSSSTITACSVLLSIIISFCVMIA